ncbi:Histone-lysine N-methyltransferase, H3 lysine-9 specific dim-like protein [Hapsidospora chrysogenum ATCC 11550]|uniref:Histone-lysine N-methyltransferase, H3 lysine-9 specific dim-like protein n=1 Tax=Hapsidospora chrysogenum (strain ATCC 11550 / CBS 779.69 / DSM 880 / IAM 14645 / JCM 23072 / IMI 49137) TaxID=857340 RepID=A0A086T0F7_HAPC1|nr:Histone-lysine N-methyltransferase, H3 lysine-9 specific dim-like protein [Hapsidospora chrysogenum ATCC 11550]
MEKATRRHFFHHGKDADEIDKKLKDEKDRCHWCQLHDENSDEGSADHGHPAKERRKAYAYHTHGAKAGLLRSRVLDSATPLYECHLACSCDPLTCPNRVVQRGRTVPLQIFRTRNRGWGVRCPELIKKGQFVDCYLGEVITAAEADNRRQKVKVSQRKDVYLFALDKFTSVDSFDPRLKGPPLEVDGEFMSGPTRFINHSCDPNMRIFARVGDQADKHLHDLALFAIRDIPRGEELTFDYVAGGVDDHDEAGPNAGNMTECLCGSKNCRKRIW